MYYFLIFSAVSKPILEKCFDEMANHPSFNTTKHYLEIKHMKHTLIIKRATKEFKLTYVRRMVIWAKLQQGYVLWNQEIAKWQLLN